MTQAEWDVIFAYVKIHPNLYIIESEDDDGSGYCIGVKKDGKMFGVIHPQSLLDIIREDING